MAPRRRLLPLVVLGLLPPTLTSCQLLSGGSTLDDALELVPAEAEAVSFLDREAQADRLGLDDLETGADEDDLAEYRETLLDEGVTTTPMGQFVETMQDSAFSEFDVVWWVRAVSEDGVFNAYELEDVDFDDLVDDLESAGVRLEEEDDRWVAEPDAGLNDALLEAGYPFDFALGVLIDPDEDLVVTGGGAGLAAEVLDDDRDSAVDAGAFDDLLDDADEPEHAELTTEPSCQVSERIGPELRERLGSSDLARFDAAAYFATADGDDLTESGVLVFPDEDAAEADVEAREAYLEDGLTLGDQRPVSSVGTAELEQDGNAVRLELDVDTPGQGLRSFLQLDAFFACGA